MEAPVTPVSITVPIVITEVIGIVLYFTNLIHFGWRARSGGFDSGFTSERKKCHQNSHMQAYNLLVLYHLVLLCINLALAVGIEYSWTFCLTATINYAFIIIILTAGYYLDVSVSQKIKAPTIFAHCNFLIFWAVAIANLTCVLKNCDKLPVVAEIYVTGYTKYFILAAGYIYMLIDAWINKHHKFTFNKIKSKEKAVSLIRKKISEIPRITVIIWNKQWMKYCSDKQGLEAFFHFILKRCFKIN